MSQAEQTALPDCAAPRDMPTYQDRAYWKKYRPFLPAMMRLPVDPVEEWWSWRGNTVHLDRVSVPGAGVKVIVLHGGGGNGRLVSAFGALVHHMGHDYVAPDLPGFGLTALSPDYDHDYRNWVELVCDLVDCELQRDGKPVVLFGGSLGGMLAYNAASRSGRARGVIATTLADPRMPAARHALARNRFWSDVGYLLMNLFPFVSARFSIPARAISRLEAITNDPAFSQVFIEDEHVGRARINLRFYRSMTRFHPEIAPEDFRVCPVLLVHPAEDRWTPYEVSRPFFERIAGEKQLVLLEGCGHFPYEEPGVHQLREAVAGFLAAV